MLNFSVNSNFKSFSFSLLPFKLRLSFFSSAQLHITCTHWSKNACGGVLNFKKKYICCCFLIFFPFQCVYIYVLGIVVKCEKQKSVVVTLQK